MLIIGDIGGNYLTLMALLQKCPKDEVLAVGDLVDRGPRSKQVLDWFMAGNGMSLMGNHEHMMLDYFTERRHYQAGVWMENGGFATVRSFTSEGYEDSHLKTLMPPYLAWLKERPLYMLDPVKNKRGQQLFVSHAPWAYQKGEEINPVDAIWHRGQPKPKEGLFQVYGHNHAGVRWHEDYAVCIDTDWQKTLTALHWPSMAIYQQEFID